MLPPPQSPTDIMDVFDSPNYLPSAWNSAAMSYPVLPTSIVIATYNRCPSPRLDQNPLCWCLHSIDAQKNASIEEIVVVNDASSDYTAMHLEVLARIINTPLIVLHNERHFGSAVTRNIGIKQAKAAHVLFGDDDCLFSPFAVAGLQHAYLRMQAIDLHTKVMHLPYYFRDLKPLRTNPLATIGTVDLHAGSYTTNLDSFPHEYLDMPVYLDSQLRLLMPLSITHLVGLFLAEKRALTQAGMFPDYFTWRNSFTEELELALSMKEQGASLYFLPDPKCFITHLKYGYRSSQLGRSIGEKEEVSRFLVPIGLDAKIAASNITVTNTGNRVHVKDWCYAKLISYYVCFSKRNRAGGQKWLATQYEHFVNRNDERYYQDTQNLIQNKHQREEIWNSARNDGETLLRTLAERSQASVR